MYAWIYNLIDRLPGFLKAAFRGVAAYFLAPWRLLIKFFQDVRATGLRLWKFAGQFKDGIVAFAFWTGRALWNITGKIIPRAIQIAVLRLTKWVTAGLARARNEVVFWVNRLARLIEAGLNALRAFVRDILTWASAQISSVFNWITRIGNRVADLVLHPDRLALWLLPALWGPLWRFIESRAEPIGRWLLARSVNGALRSADVIERVIARIL